MFKQYFDPREGIPEKQNSTKSIIKVGNDVMCLGKKKVWLSLGYELREN